MRQPSRAITAAAFDAVSDPTRRAILDLLRTGERSVTDIAGEFVVSRPAISKHLRILRRADVVRDIRRGRRRIYRLHAPPLRAVDAWLQPYRRYWDARLAGLKRFIEAEGGAPPPPPRRSTPLPEEEI